MSIRTALLLALGLCLALARPCHSQALAPVPPEIASSHFVVTINGAPSPVMHAAINLYFLNFQAKPHAVITVTADTDDFWSSGVEIQPWRLNIRPRRTGRTIAFTLDGASKITISRPGDFFSNSQMLYLFANPAPSPVITDASPGIRYYGPGVHHENIDAVGGDHIYLAEGAVVFGSLNIWQVDHVTVSGRGVIVYDGPQNPVDDDGWMHKKNWHCIVMDNAHDISIEGITCVVRSRTWQIQMKDSRRILFDNVKVIGANTGNANADGMDWLGGGDTVVKDSFIRAADDVFALQSGWDGYGPVSFAKQGKPVTNIRIEGGLFSTSISNIVRAGWPEKNFEGGNFSMHDADILHTGLGGCGIPFALMELWADPHGRGESAGFHFDNIRLEDWYSLTQLQEPVEGVSDVSFTDIAGLESPSLVASSIKGAIHSVTLDSIVLAANTVDTAASLPLTVQNGAEAPRFPAPFAQVHIATTQGLIRPGDKVSFVAQTDAPGLQYRWFFGDGDQSTGRHVKHRFHDTDGTLLDGSGRFRVLLQARNPAGRELWTYTPIIVSDALQPALAPATNGQPGLTYTYEEPSPTDATPRQGLVPTLSLDGLPHAAPVYRITFEGDLDVPADGGYSFLLIANEQASLSIDGARMAESLAPIAQVCGMPGSAARLLRASASFNKGRHHIQVLESHSEGEDNFRFLWQGPDIPLQPVPAARWTHSTILDL